MTDSVGGYSNTYSAGPAPTVHRAIAFDPGFAPDPGRVPGSLFDRPGPTEPPPGVSEAEFAPESFIAQPPVAQPSDDRIRQFTAITQILSGIQQLMASTPADGQSPISQQQILGLLDAVEGLLDAPTTSMPFVRPDGWGPAPIPAYPDPQARAGGRRPNG